MFSKKLAALVATSLVVATSPAVAQSAAPTPVVSTVNADASELGGYGAGGVWAALIGVALLAAFVLVLTEDDTDLEEGRVSP